MDKLISFVIPAYNSADTVERTLDSIFNQELADSTEVIVVDDCSTDNTLEILQQYSQNRHQICIVATEQNSGPGIARDKGVSVSKGHWVAFVDSDDQIAENFITIIQKTSASLDKSTDIIATGYVSYIKKTKFVRDDFPLLALDKEGIIENHLLERISNLSIGHLFKREFLVKNQIFHRPGFHEDVDFSFICFLKANKIFAIEQTLYFRYKRKNSIMDTFGIQHVQGWFGAFKRIHQVLSTANIFEEHKHTYKMAVVNLVASRLLTLVNQKQNLIDTPQNIFTSLCKNLTDISQMLDLTVKDFLFDYGSMRTKYQMIFGIFLRFYQFNTVDKVELLLAELEKIRDKSWSCYDLHNSVFFAPDQIRTCCKRYYHKGQLKGDVVLYSLEKSPNTNIEYQDIANAKDALYKEINRDNAPECEACPYLKFDNWGGLPSEKNFNYLSFEYHSVCNMRCSYCSDMFYGGKKPYYDINRVVESLVESGAVNNCEHILWAGGEPTINKDFPKLFNLVSGAVDIRQRVISNCTIFSEELAEQLKQDKLFLVVSVDAGTQKTFEKVRKYKRFDQVLDNIKKYSEVSADNIVVKYIFTEDNYQFDEIQEYVKCIDRLGLQGCNFQISYNFYKEAVEEKFALSMAALYGLLSKTGANYIFLDDLVWQRFPNQNKRFKDKMVKVLDDLSITGCFADPKDYPNVVAWGVGRGYEMLAEKSEFLSQTNIEYFIDSRPENIGSQIDGKDVFAQDKVLEDDLPILICAAFPAVPIYKQIKAMGIDPGRVINKMVL